MKICLRVLTLVFFVFLLGACDSKSSDGNVNGGIVNGGNGGDGGDGDLNVNITISLMQSEDGTYTFKSESDPVRDDIKYSWDFGGRVNQPAQRSVASPVVTYVDEGDYTVQLTAEIKSKIFKSNIINISYYQPVRVKSNYGMKNVYSGGYRYLAGVINNNKLHYWGYSEKYAVPYESGELIKDVALTSNSYIALTESGKIYAYGDNNYGVLGDGTYTSRRDFKIIETLQNVKINKIYTGKKSVYAVDSNGKVWSWGDNEYGQLGIGSNEAKNNIPVQIPELNNVVDIAIGYASVYALTKNGEVYSWGDNANGQLGIDNTTMMTSPVKIKAFVGKEITAISVDGFKYSDTSVWHTAFAIDKDGKLYGWGANGYGILSNTLNNKVPNIIEGLKDKFIVSVAQNSTGSVFALDGNGQVYSWGTGSEGELGHGNSDNITEPKLIEYFSNKGIVVKKIIAGLGTKSTFAIDSEGKLYAWGYDNYGQLGVGRNGGTEWNQYLPVYATVFDGIKIINVESGDEVTFAVSNTGKVYVTGYNTQAIRTFGMSSVSGSRNEFIEFVPDTVLK